MITAEEEDMKLGREVTWRESHRCGTLKEGLPSLKSNTAQRHERGT